MRNESQAREYVASKCDYASAPVLTSEEIATCVTDSARWTTRANSTAYTVGQRTAPATPNGRIYECVVSGTSASSAPTWPTSGMYCGQRITDGTVTWKDAGPAYREQYDVNAAIRAAWMLKAAKAAAWVDVSDGDASIKRDQIINHCQAMANRYPPVYVT